MRTLICPEGHTFEIEEQEIPTDIIQAVCTECGNVSNYRIEMSYPSEIQDLRSIADSLIIEFERQDNNIDHFNTRLTALENTPKYDEEIKKLQRKVKKESLFGAATLLIVAVLVMILEFKGVL